MRLAQGPTVPAAEVAAEVVAAEAEVLASAAVADDATKYLLTQPNR